MKKRNEYLDIIKGIAIILVVLGHCVQYGSGVSFLESGQFFSDPVFKFIYSFHMPLFMLVSGYLFFHSARRPAKDVLLSKAKGILVPLIAWHSCFLLLQYSFGEGVPVSIIHLTYLHTLWFLRALFFCCVLVLFLRCFLRDNIYVYIAVIMALPFVHNRILPSVFVFTIPYFIIGYLFHKLNGIVFISRMKYSSKVLTCMASGALFFIFLHFFGSEYYAYVTNSYVFQPSHSFSFIMYVNIYRYLTAVFGCIFMLMAIHLIYHYLHRAVVACLSALSHASLCIYIVNYYINDTILISLPISGVNYALILALSVVVIMVGYGLYWLLGKNSVTRLLFLGGR